MRVVATGDFHGRVLADIPECDLLIYAGDVGGEQFAFGPFKDWLERVPAKEIVGVAGNHDWWTMPSGWDRPKIQDILHDSLAYNLPWTYLYNESYVVDGLTVWGSPFCNRFCDWAYMGDETDLARVWATMPDDTDLVVTHGPPYGCCDRVARTGAFDPHVGSTTLRERLAASRVRYAVCGHIHEAYGWDEIEREDGGRVEVFNVSAVTETYAKRDDPAVVFDVEIYPDHVKTSKEET